MISPWSFFFTFFFNVGGENEGRGGIYGEENQDGEGDRVGQCMSVCFACGGMGVLDTLRKHCGRWQHLRCAAF